MGGWVLTVCWVNCGFVGAPWWVGDGGLWVKIVTFWLGVCCELG